MWLICHCSGRCGQCGLCVHVSTKLCGDSLLKRFHSVTTFDFGTCSNAVEFHHVVTLKFHPVTLWYCHSVTKHSFTTRPKITYVNDVVLQCTRQCGWYVIEVYYVVERGGLWDSATVWWTMWLPPQWQTMWYIPQCGGLCGLYQIVVDYVVVTTVWWTRWFIPQCGGLCGSYHSVVDYVVHTPE